MNRNDRRALGLAATIGVPGLMHFAAPQFFDAVVPRWMPGSRRTVTYVSGVVELASAALTLHPATRRIGAWMCLATFIGVYPANIQMALDGGIADAPPSAINSAAAAWIRLPLQFPMMWSAWRVARQGTVQTGERSRGERLGTNAPDNCSGVKPTGTSPVDANR